MKKLAALLLTVACSGATLRSLQTATNPATGTLASFPLGNFQWAMRFHGLPTSAPGSDQVLLKFNTDGSHFITCEIPSGTLNFVCFDSNNSSFVGAPSVPLAARTDLRVVITREKITPTNNFRMDTWAGDCTAHTWSNISSTDAAGEPSTSSSAFALGGTSVAIAFFRALPFPSGGIGADPPCPGDAPTAVATAMDCRFETNTLTNACGAGYTLTAAGSSFANSTTYNPAVIITGSWSAPRPVVAQTPFTLDCSNTVVSDGNATPTTYAWVKGGGDPAGTFSATNTATTVFTPTADGSFHFTCTATDASSNSGNGTLNVGVVNSDANGIKIQTNAELGWIIGKIPRYGTSPWPWYDKTEAIDAEVLLPYYQAIPAPAALFTGSGLNDFFFSGRGTSSWALGDVYDVKISATGSPDSYQWRKNGGSYSSSIPITETSCYGNPRTIAVGADGMIACFSNTTGHTLNDMWSTMAPQAGTATITGTGGNKLDSTTGQVTATGSGACGGSIEVIGSGTTWSTGTVTQKLIPGSSYWLEWNYTGSNNDGRFFFGVVSVQTDTKMCISGNAGFWPIPVAQSSAMKIQQAGQGTNIQESVDFYILFGYPSNFIVNSNMDYYEAGLGIIRLAEATNLDIYTNEAQGWCNTWFQYELDHGYNAPIPRASGWHTLTACASKFGQNWWGLPVTTSPGSGLAYSLTYNPNFINPTSAVSRDNLFGVDIRELANAASDAAIFTHAYPSHTASPSATTTTWCGYSTNLINNLWLSPWVGSGGLYTLTNSNNDSYWQDDQFGLGSNINGIAGFPAGNISNMVMGTSPWRDSGLAIIGLTELYNVMNADCASPTLAASTKTAVQKSVSYLQDYGRSPDGGSYYNTGYQSNGIYNQPTGDVLHNYGVPYEDGGNSFYSSIAVSGTTVTGQSPISAFTRRFGPCNSTTSINISGTNYTVTACASDTSMTIGAAPGNGTYNFSQWYNPGTIAVTNGSSTVTVGSGSTATTKTGFQSFFAPCDGTTFIGILGATGADNGVYQVTACADQTHLTISPAWSGANQTTQKDFVYSHLASTSCAPSIGTCETGAFGGLGLAHDWAVSFGQKYQWSSSATDRTNLEYQLGSLYSGPAAGPAFVGPNSGPQSTLGPSNFDNIIPDCATTHNVQPCVQFGRGDGLTTGIGVYAKPFGESTGSGNSRNAIADYLAGQGSASRKAGPIRFTGKTRR